MPTLEADLLSFVHRAKLATYATQADAASVPRLPDSKQLEFSDGHYLYRDVYVGVLRFVGQEIVYRDERAVWSMSYAGGLAAGVDASEAAHVYRAVRSALRAVAADFPARGPSQLELEGLRYTCLPAGNFARFYGEERVTRDTAVLYELRFAGGALA